MVLLTDTREQQKLVFEKVVGVEYCIDTLKVGDYTALHDNDVMDTSVVERKNVGDCFSSFGKGYKNEKAKIVRSKEMGLHYILAIEATASQILQGHQYWKDGQMHEHGKSGIAMIRQLMSLQRRYSISVWFCDGRADMAMRVQEYFLAWERVK